VPLPSFTDGSRASSGWYWKLYTPFSSRSSTPGIRALWPPKMVSTSSDAASNSWVRSQPRSGLHSASVVTTG